MGYFIEEFTGSLAKINGNRCTSPCIGKGSVWREHTYQPSSFLQVYLQVGRYERGVMSYLQFMYHGCCMKSVFIAY